MHPWKNSELIRVPILKRQILSVIAVRGIDFGSSAFGSRPRSTITGACDSEYIVRSRTPADQVPIVPLACTYLDAERQAIFIKTGGNDISAISASIHGSR